MATQEGTFELIARHLVLAVEPLRRAVADVDAFAAFLRRLGWDATSLPPAFQDLAGIVLDALAELDGLADDPGPDDVARVLGQVRRLYEALTAIAETPAGIDPADAATFAAELAERLFELLLTDYLAAALPGVHQALMMLGVIQAEHHQATATRPAHVRTRLRWDQLARLFTDPGSLPSAVYGWGTPAFSFELLRDHVHELLWALGLAATVERVPEELADAWQPNQPTGAGERIETRVRLWLAEVDTPQGALPIGLALTALPAEQAPGGPLPAGVIVQPDVPEEVGAELPIPPALVLRVRAGTDLAGLFGVLIRPGSVAVRYPLAPGTPLPSAGFGVTLAYAPETPAVLLGRPGASRVELAGAAVGVAVDLDRGALTVGTTVELDGLSVVVTAGELDGFLGTVLGGATVVLPVTLGLTWSSATGFAFTGEAGFEISLAPNLQLGPISVDRLLLGLRSGVSEEGTAEVAALVGVGLSGQLGPVGFAVDGLGLTLDLRLEPGRAGPFDLAVGLRPPSGLGLTIAAGPVAGGGFVAFDPEAGRYFGALAVRVAQVSVSAIGLLDTRLPGGERGFSLLIVLAARFQGIQLGYGIFLTGVGGLLAVNRRFDTDALLERFATGTVGRILAPEDPVRDAPTLLGELSAVFPPAEGVVVVGPTVQLTWLDVVKADLGIFVELPSFAKIVLLGVVRAVLDNPDADKPMLQLRCDLVGVLDFAAKTLSFDTVLTDSTLLEVFTVTGGTAFRLSWGDEPYVLLSVGGFHPGFSPAPLVLPPSLTRMALAYSAEDTYLNLRAEGYFAITPNTLQLGARVQADITFGALSAHGYLGFDVLIRFQPFAFQLDFEARVEVRWRGRTLAGVRLRGALTGPGPVVLTGEVCIEILFFSICASVTVQIGSEAPPVVTPVASALDALAAELRDPANLAATGADPLVVLRPPPAAVTLPVLPPFGELVWRQRRAPLGLLLERFDGVPLAGHETVTAASAQLAGEEHDWFAPGGFAELSDAEAVNRRSFERLPGGVRLGAGGETTSATLVHEVTVLEFRLPEPEPVTADGFVPPGWLARDADRRAGLGGGDQPAPQIGVGAEPWQVRGDDGRLLAETASGSQAHQLARARAGGAAAVPAGDLVTLVNA